MAPCQMKEHEKQVCQSSLVVASWTDIMLLKRIQVSSFLYVGTHAIKFDWLFAEIYFSTNA